MEINNLEDFKRLVQENKIKDKWYFYKRTEETKQKQAIEMLSLINYFKQKLNLLLYPVSGTLLGILREHDFISHDNDVDLAYLSNKNTKDEVLKEFYQICNFLESEKLLTKICKKGQLHCFGESKTFKYDIWTSFIINNKFYLIPIINGELNKSVLLPLKNYIFRDCCLNIPFNSKKLLTYIYQDWETINFNLGSNLKWKNIL